MTDEALFSSWKEHWIAKGGEEAGFVLQKAGIAYLNLPAHDEFDRLMPFGVVSGEGGHVLVLMSRERAWRKDREAKAQPFVAISSDGGETFPEAYAIPGLSGRPVSLAKYSDTHYVFKCFSYQNGKATVTRVQTYDGGRTWPDRNEEAPSPLLGRVMASEGSPAIVQTDSGQFLYEIVCDSAGHPVSPSTSYVRRYAPDGSFADFQTPDAWKWSATANGTTYARCADEGSIAALRDGGLVAALRTNMLPEYFAGVHDDSLEGLAISHLSPDGRDASPLRVLYTAGRHHPHLLALPKGELLLTNIVRTDVRNGKLASFRRGCEAIVSTDGGRAFDPRHKYVLDWYNYLHDGRDWVNGMCGHCASALVGERVLTVYGNYLNRGATLIFWKAE